LQVRQVRLDSKGRVTIPAEFRESIGETVTVMRTGDGILIAPEGDSTFQERFGRIIASEPRRTGRPENWSPDRMKRIWNEGK
jgi:AbrB family looped-hinge helix DNA binding protein